MKTKLLLTTLIIIIFCSCHPGRNISKTTPKITDDLNLVKYTQKMQDTMYLANRLDSVQFYSKEPVTISATTTKKRIIVKGAITYKRTTTGSKVFFPENVMGVDAGKSGKYWYIRFENKRGNIVRAVPYMQDSTGAWVIASKNGETIYYDSAEYTIYYKKTPYLYVQFDHIIEETPDQRIATGVAVGSKESLQQKDNNSPPSSLSKNISKSNAKVHQPPPPPPQQSEEKEVPQ